MISVSMDFKSFERDMKNIMEYSIGFLDGTQKGKNQFLDNLGKDAIEVLKEYVDMNARVDPASLHHVYEWSQTGNPDGRLFDITYAVNSAGVSVLSTFRQSSSVKDGSTVPFFDKAGIMENGTPVVIRSKKTSGVLAFDSNGERVFTKKPIKVDNPGGDVQGKYEKTFNDFFNSFFTQSYLKSSGMVKYLQTPRAYKDNLSRGKSGGRSVGLATGYKWITNTGAGI